MKVGPYRAYVRLATKAPSQPPIQPQATSIRFKVNPSGGGDMSCKTSIARLNNASQSATVKGDVRHPLASDARAAT